MFRSYSGESKLIEICESVQFNNALYKCVYISPFFPVTIITARVA